MERSVDRVLTTHTGSLPRPDDLARLHIDRAEGRPVDDAHFEERVRAAVEEAVARQVEIGVDVVSDGEMSKNTYIEYTRERLSGMGGLVEVPDFYFTDLVEFPELVEATYKDSRPVFPFCDGPIRYTGGEIVGRDVKNFAAALAKHPATEAFIPAASPGVVAHFCPNKYYASYDEYLMALAEAMNAEYKAITEAGFLVQVDAPELALGADCHTWMWSEIERRGFEEVSRVHVQAINRALDGISPEKARLHLCWANYQGPHTHDYPFSKVLQTALGANVAAFNFEAANPAHAHEWELFENFKLPDDIVLMPGVIDTKSQVVEHPRAVAHRIMQYARVVGQERVIAATDCGFGTFVGALLVHPKIVWMKLRSLVEGAAIASEELAKGTGKR
ncbi:MAG: cobalamin-independent methionine synthase II family protein [Actinomycetota bacterium]